jgi:YegS/Rv2252/BmrU family lipid kinase
MTDTRWPLRPGSPVRAVLIYNPRSGTHDIQAQLPSALQVFREHGWQVDVQATQRAGDVRRLAAAAIGNRCAVVVVAGGDGSLNEAANALAQSEVALATLPTGTANVWARQIGLPIPAPWYSAQLADAARSMCRGLIRPIDLGRTNERYFMLWSGAGLDAYVTSKIEPRPPWVKRWGAAGYGLRAAWYALYYRGTPMTIEIDDQPPRHDRAVMVLISNIQLYAGIVRPTPEARIDDGLLDVCLFKGHRFAHTVWHFGSIALGRGAHDPELIQLRGRHIRVSPKQPTAVHVDAEPIGVTPIDVHVVPHALRVVVPQTAPATLFTD